jgi:Rhodopirellula transposase DDE domain
MKLTDSLKPLFIDTAAELTGAARRLLMAKVVKQLGSGGQSQAEQELGWNRGTLRKGLHELESGVTCLDNYSARGRKPCETSLPRLLEDLQAVVDGQSQTDPTFKSTRLYVRLSVREIRGQLIKPKGYLGQELPCDETLRQTLNELGYHQRRVKKTRPQKKNPETNAIFEQLQMINQEADTNPDTLRISIDAKATVKLGSFDRGGKTRVCTTASDHDFATQTVTP